MQTTTILDMPEFTLTRITLDIPLKGFRDFITPWLITEDKSGRSLLIDPGPTCGIPSLKKALLEVGVTSLDLVLLTHIHIDHAGGVSHLIKDFPNAKLVVHPRGTPHLIDPSRLWSSTLETLGKDVAYAYGEILPVPAGRILPEHVVPENFEIIDTPGHSQHHQSYLYRAGSGDIVFEGEAAGVYLCEGYLRPATPPKFFYETSAKSIAELRARAAGARLMLSGHYGYSSDVGNTLDASLRQLAFWMDITQAVIQENPNEHLAGLVETSVARLTKSDPLLVGLDRFPADIKEREIYFLHNSARGFVSAQLRPDRTGG